jgi:broad specificity phosphatase PhoE
MVHEERYGPRVTSDRPELWLVRHGETEWSAAGRHTSRTDLDLTEDGRTHASALRERLAGVDFARVLSSPRLRAQQTAQLAGFADRIELLDDLTEWDYGDDEGRTSAEIQTERPGWTVWDDGPAGGETATDVRRRADHVIAVARAEVGPVLAFTHGHFARVLGARWIGLEVAGGAHLLLSTASVCVLGAERDVPALRLWNDTGHLD